MKNFAYLAGIVDGEGTIDIIRNKNRSRVPFPRLLVTGTNKGLAQWLESNFGGDVHWRTNRGKPNWKPEFAWRIANRKALSLIGAIYPHLIVKRSQAFFALSLGSVKEMARSRKTYDIVSLGHRKGSSFGPETMRSFEFIEKAIKLFNARGVNSLDPDKYIEAVARGEAV